MPVFPGCVTRASGRHRAPRTSFLIYMIGQEEYLCKGVVKSQGNNARMVLSTASGAEQCAVMGATVTVVAVIVLIIVTLLSTKKAWGFSSWRVEG